MKEIKEKTKWETIQYISKYVAIGMILNLVGHVALRVWKKPQTQTEEIS